MNAIAPDILNARLVGREDLHAELSIVRIARESGPAPAFKPGQFITLGLPRVEDEILDHEGEGDVPADRAAAPGALPRGDRVRLTRRAYSLTSSANDQDAIEVFLTRIVDGRFTPQIWQYAVGDRLWMGDRVAGEFTLDAVPHGRDLVFISTGTGVAPFVSMIRTFRGRGRWRRCVLVNGVRFARDLGFRGEFEELARADDTFRYVPLVSREPESAGWPGLRGRVQRVLDPGAFAALTGCELNPAECDIFLCGNPAMIAEVQGRLVGQGFQLHRKREPGNLHVERYW